MPKFDTVRRVQFTPEQMFALVADVEKYPQFVPMCERLVVRSRKERDGVVLLVADMGVGYKQIRETFISQVVLRAEDLRIDVKYLDGPFKYLRNTWSFEQAPNGCDVKFDIDYEFKSRILGAVMGAVFDRAFRMFSGAFEERAKQIYGAPSTGSAVSA